MPKNNQFFSSESGEKHPDEAWRMIYAAMPPRDLLSLLQTSKRHRRLVCDVLFDHTSPNAISPDTIMCQVDALMTWAFTPHFNPSLLLERSKILKTISSVHFPYKLPGLALLNRLDNKEYHWDLMDQVLDSFAETAGKIPPMPPMSPEDEEKVLFTSRLYRVFPYLSQKQKQKLIQPFFEDVGVKWLWFDILTESSPWIVDIFINSMNVEQQKKALQWFFEKRSHSFPEICEKASQVFALLMPYVSEQLKEKFAADWIKCIKDTDRDNARLSLWFFPVFSDYLEPNDLILVDELIGECLDSSDTVYMQAAISILPLRFPELTHRDKIVKRVITILEGDYPSSFIDVAALVRILPSLFPILNISEQGFFIDAVLRNSDIKITAHYAEVPRALAECIPYWENDLSEWVIVPVLFDALERGNDERTRENAAAGMILALWCLKEEERRKEKIQLLLDVLGDSSAQESVRTRLLESLIFCVQLFSDNQYKTNVAEQIMDHVRKEPFLMAAFVNSLPDYVEPLSEVLPRTELMRQVMGAVEQEPSLMEAFVSLLPDYKEELAEALPKTELMNWLLEQLKHGDFNSLLSALSDFYSDLSEAQQNAVLKSFWSLVEQKKVTPGLVLKYRACFKNEDTLKIFNGLLETELSCDCLGAREALFSLLLDMNNTKQLPKALRALVIKLNKNDTPYLIRQVLCDVTSSFLLSHSDSDLIRLANEMNQGTNLESVLLKQTTAFMDRQEARPSNSP